MKQVEERYISLLTDFGFKRIFGSAPNKDLLICFLNSLFNGRQVVKDVKYLNPEKVGDRYTDRNHPCVIMWSLGNELQTYPNLPFNDWGETWACGTGTCATVAALTELGVCPAGEDVHVQLRGGELTIRVLPGKQLLMTGAAETVCEGTTEV